jgi:hypothetical protein
MPENLFDLLVPYIEQTTFHSIHVRKIPKISPFCLLLYEKEISDSLAGAGVLEQSLLWELCVSGRCVLQPLWGRPAGGHAPRNVLAIIHSLILGDCGVSFSS